MTYRQINDKFIVCAFGRLLGSYTCSFEREDYDPMTQFVAIRNNSTRLTYDINLNKTLIYSRSAQVVGIDYERQLVYGLNPGVKQSYLQIMLKPATGGSLSYTNGELGFGTGSKVTAVDKSGNTKEYELVIFGDLNGDGYYDGQDAVLCNVISSGLYDYGEACTMAADCNHDGDITEEDSAMIAANGVMKNVEITQYPQ